MWYFTPNLPNEHDLFTFSVFTSKIVNPIRQMPYQLDFNTSVIQIMGGHFYIDKITPYVVLTTNGSLWYLRPMVILTTCVISILLVQ